MRYIDADSLKESLLGKSFYPAMVKSAIENAPTIDAVEVVRCKDCVYWENGKDYLPYCNCSDGGIDDYPQADDFCSYGIRKDAEQIANGVTAQKHGQWELRMGGIHKDLRVYSCSNCGFELPYNPTKIPRFCEECGAQLKD